ncbi:MAG TPA: protein-glutamate O-methyltransferase [Steroidobacteraceae bacterium]
MTNGVGGADFVLTDAEFHRICELVREHTGIALSEAKRQMVYARLARRLRALKLPSFAAYLELLERTDALELEEFANAITTNLTSFFREPHHFDYLAEHVLPKLGARAATGGRLRIWSCACSTGEEAYSIAMVLRECQARLHGIDARVLATDLDSNVLATAAAGHYPAERLRGVSKARVAKFFKIAGGTRQGMVKTVASLRELIIFKQLNLVQEWPMRGPFDAIFCRNVVIYFDLETKRALFERMARLQPPGAILFLGHSESLYRISDHYELIGRTIYRRVGAQA